jgi:hypothetical protein
MTSPNEHKSPHSIREASSTAGTTTAPVQRMALWTTLKLLLAVAFCVAALDQWPSSGGRSTTDTSSSSSSSLPDPHEQNHPFHHRRLLEETTGATTSHDGAAAAAAVVPPPPYMMATLQDLDARHALFDGTPPEEIKYWFEYSGPLQVRHALLCICCYHCSCWVTGK